MQMPEMFDNVSRTVKDDLTVTIKKGDKLSVAAACFSIYAYQALKLWVTMRTLMTTTETPTTLLPSTASR